MQLFATKILVWFYFRGIKDKSGKPYYRHLKEVGHRGSTRNAKIVGYLHDILEDTPCSENFLRRHYSDEIVEAVLLLTKTEETEISPYYSKIKDNPLAREVKMNDLIHNSNLCRIQCPTNRDIQRTKRYIQYLEFLNESCSTA